MLICQLQCLLGIVDRRSDLPLMTNDAGVVEQTTDVFLAKLGHLNRIEPGEPRSEVLPLVENCQPGEPCLKALQTDLLEESLVVGNSPAPLIVVVGAIDLGLDAPPAAIEAVFSSVYLHHLAELTSRGFNEY